MVNLADTLISQEKTSPTNIPGYQSLLSDSQIYSILEQTSKLHGGETSQEVFSVLSDIIYRIYGNLRKTPKYDPDTMRNQSSRELLSKKDVFFMNTCLEYSLLTLQYMKQIGFTDTKLIIHELDTSYKGFFKLHFGVEGTHEQKKYYVDHKRRNSVLIGKGDFESDYTDVNENVVNTIEVPSGFIGIDDTFPDLYKKGIIDFKYFSPDLLPFFKEKFKKDNTIEERQNGFIAKVKHPDKPEITIKNNIN